MLEFLIIGLVILAVTSLWVLIEQRKSPKFLIWFIPVLLILVSSTYLTYTSILGHPRSEIPKKGIYLKHYTAEPDWIYLWMLGEDNVPISYKFVYSPEVHNSLEGVEKKVQEGDFMILGEVEDNGVEGEGEGEQIGEGYTIGGDMSFYKWDFKTQLPPKNITN